MGHKKSLVCIVRHTPYGSSLGRAALDTALAAAAFEQPVSLLFLGDGVLQLLPGQEAGALGRKNVGRLLASLPLYDIDRVFVDAAAVGRYGLDLDTVPVPVTALDEAAIRELIANSDHLLGF